MNFSQALEEKHLRFMLLFTGCCGDLHLVVMRGRECVLSTINVCVCVCMQVCLISDK